MHSISTSTFLGSVLTATQLRAGLWVNHLEYSSFMAWPPSQQLWQYLDVVPSSYNLWRVTTYDEVGHVGDEDVHLDDLLDAGAGGGEHGLQVLDTGGRLLLNGALNQVTLGIAGDLAGAVNGRRGLDGVGLQRRWPRLR